jgi:CRP-like cAMP-binding protein
MPVPDRHANEPTREVQAEAYSAWVRAKTAAEAWKAEEQRLRSILELAMGDADAATINGRKVLTNRFTERIATKRLQEDYPDLTEHFMRDQVVHEFDLTSFLLVHRDIAEKYRVRSFRVVAEPTEVETDDQGS